MEANALGRESEKEGDESEHDGKDEKDTDEEIFPSQSVLSGSESNEGNDSDERDEPDETDDHPIPNGSVGEEERKKLKSIRIKREFNGQDGFVSNFDAAFDDVEVKLEVEEEENVDGVVSGRKSRRAAASAASNSIKNSSEIQERSEEFFEDEDEGTLKKKRRKSVRENVDIKSGSVHCLVCDKGFRTLPYLRKHVKMGKCGRTYPEEELAKLKDQVSKKTNSSSALPEGEGFECEACHRVLATKAGRARHITRSPSCKEFYGGDDDSDFDVEEYKLRHSRTPDEYEIPETCMACDKVLDNHEQLLEHVELKPDCKEIYENHKAIQYEEYVDQTCEICRTTLPSLLQLVNHFKDNPDCEREYGSKEVQKISEKIRLQWMEREEEERKEKETVKSRRKSNNKRSKKLNQKNKSKLKLKNRTSVDLSDQGDDGESKRARDEQWEPQGVLNVDDLESVDPEICVHPELPIAGGSKIDHEDDTVEDLLVLPEGTSLTGQYASPKEINAAEFFVGMGLSNDGESIEVRYLLHRQNITLDGLQLLFHAVMSVTECDAKTLMNDRSSPLTLVPHYDVLKYRDKFSKDLMAAGNVMPSPGKVICQALPSQETHFIAEDMVEIPNTQLIYNESLHPVDIGAVGIQSSSGEDSNKVYKVSPLFTVNMEDWRKTIKSFYQILFNWFGGRDKLQEILLNTPCGKTALDAWLTDIREECHQNNMEPKITEICEHCGQCLEYNKFITSEVRAYRMHLKSHDLTCKTCGEESSSVTAKKYHQRTHLKHFVRCDKCNYVGTTESSLATHIKFTHTKAVCQICGNEFTCHNGLTSHMQHVHNPEENNKKWYETEPSQCDICNKWFSNHKIMRRHRKNHDEAKPEPAARSSTGAKEDPNDFKFMCPIHDTCKKYFKSRKHLRSHLKKFKERDILDNSSNGMAEGALIGVLSASSGDFVKPQLSGHKEDVRLPPESTPQQQPQPDDLFGLLKKKSNQTPIDPDAEERRRRKKLTKKRPHPQQQALHHSQQLQQLNLQQQQQHPHLPTGSSDYHTPITPFVPNSDNCAFGNSSVNPYQPHPGSQALAQSVPPHHLQANPYRNPYVGHFPDPNSFKFFNHAYVPGGMHTPLTSEIHVRDMSMAKEEVLSD